MNRLYLNHCAVVAALVLLSGCGGQGSGAIPTPPLGKTSTALSKASSQDLLYTGVGTGSQSLSIYTFPQIKYVTTFTLPKSAQTDIDSLCSDTKGNIFVVANDFHGKNISDVFEYAHGATTPFKTLSLTSMDAGACAVDPTTGDLALAGSKEDYNQYSSVAIYKGGKGQPTLYTDNQTSTFFSLSYDGNSNLVLCCVAPFYQLAALFKGGSSLDNIKFKPHAEYGQVLWDGKSLVLFGTNQHAERKYFAIRFNISGDVARGTSRTIIRTKYHTVGQGAILGSYMVAGDVFKRINLWPYPGGGLSHAYKVSDLPSALAISVAPSK